MARNPLSIDPNAETKRVVKFVRSRIKGADAEGVVIGLSGGIDSSVVGELCLRALGVGKVLAILMPSNHTPAQDVEDARMLSKAWGIDPVEVKISRLVEELVSLAGTKGTKIASANAQARIRMSILYYHANTRNYLVAGTGDKSEIALGYFTKWGDGGVDFLPIAHLYKTQVMELGRNLGLPNRIVTKPPSPRLWPGHRALDELPADYDELDLVLHYLFDMRLSPTGAATKAGVSMAVVKRVLEMHRKSAHKRALPPSLA